MYIIQCLEICIYPGVLQICENCYLAGYSKWELANNICLKPFQHNFPYADRFYAAWDHKTNTLVAINPRPKEKNNEFSLCERGTLCSQGNCLKPHSEIERDAWNYDLGQAAKGSNQHVLHAILT